MRKTILLSLLACLFLVPIISAVSFTPIFCNDYEFTCCNSYKYFDETRTKNQAQAMVCSETAIYCEVENIVADGLTLSNYGYYVGSQNCGLDDAWYNSPHYECGDERKEYSTSIRLEPGERIYFGWRGIGKYTMTYRFKAYSSKLTFCGGSGCTSGVAVAGADKCTFRPDGNTVYTSTSALSGKKTAYSYTVPYQPPTNCVLAWQSGNRHVCGYEEESCNSDSDCGGHTYGNKECYGRTLQTYGCRSYGNTLNGYDRGPFNSGWGTDKSEPMTSGGADFGRRCEIINSKSVQCCGDTDCGSNFFCDTETFTCKEEVECYNDYDCGVSEICDAYSNTYKTARCDGGECVRDEKDVECCQDYNCPDGYYCNIDYECRESEKEPQPCLKECCVGISGFIDKPCPSDRSICCADQSCAESEGECSGGNVVESIEAGNCNDKEDNDGDGLVDENDPDCAICVVDDMEYNLGPKQCCEKKGGTWVDKEKSSWFGLKKTDESYCNNPNILLYAGIFIIIILVLVLIGWGIYVFNN